MSWLSVPPEFSSFAASVLEQAGVPFEVIGDDLVVHTDDEQLASVLAGIGATTIDDRPIPMGPIMLSDEQEAELLGLADEAIAKAAVLRLLVAISRLR